MGPVEYAIVEFPDADFHVEIVPPLERLVSSGLVRIIDIAFITKSTDGVVSAVEIEDLEELEAFGSLAAAVGEMLIEEDIAYVGAGLDPGTSAAILLWEDLWATELTDAVEAAGGALVEGVRIPAVLIEEAELVLAEAVLEQD